MSTLCEKLNQRTIGVFTDVCSVRKVIYGYVTGIKSCSAELVFMFSHIGVDLPHLRHGVQNDLGIPFCKETIIYTLSRSILNIRCKRLVAGIRAAVWAHDDVFVEQSTHFVRIH